MTNPIVPTPESTDNLKRCTKCGELKPYDQFYKTKRRKGKPSPSCKVCVAKNKRQYYAENVEAIKARNLDNHEELAERRHQYYIANRERIKENSRQYRMKNRTKVQEKARVRKHRRYARQLELPADFTITDWQVALNAFNGCCAVCGRPAGLWHTLAADHWIPLDAPDCPGTVPHNIVPLCHGIGGCNNSKRNRPACEWLVDQFGKRKGRAIQRRIESWLDEQRR